MGTSISGSNMLFLAWRQVRGRGVRTIALLLGVFVATAGFVLLTTQSDSSRLVERGLVGRNSRSSYDILVRPASAATSLEQSRGLVQAQFLSGVYGGITIRQWGEISRIPGVDIAAPTAVLGYVVPRVQVWVDAGQAVGGTGRGAARAVVTWSTDNGLTRERAQPTYVYVTPHQLTAPDPQLNVREIDRPGSSVVVCPASVDQGTTVSSQPSDFWCWSRTPSPGSATPPPGISAKAIGFELTWPVPFVLAGIDPRQEQRIDGMASAMSSGHYLNGTPIHPTENETVLPVIAADRSVTDLAASVSIERLPGDAVQAIAAGASPARLSNVTGSIVARVHLNQQQAYGQLLAGLKKAPSANTGALIDRYWTVSPASFDAAGRSATSILSPSSITNTPSSWGDLNSGDTNGSLVPAGADDVTYRKLTVHQQSLGQLDSPLSTLLHLTGVFDPRKLPGFTSLTAVPLGTYANPPITGADTRSRQLLAGQPLQASTNIAGYAQTPPLLLTNLSGMEAMLRSVRSPYIRDPISSVRVRVAYVHGVDPLSRERVRAVAQAITQQTGLHVDITLGSSPSPQAIALSVGRHGRPALALHENWVRKGVAVAISSALDRKSLALFALVLLVCALFVGNTAAADVRTRRTELGILACLGWRRRQILALVATEILGVAWAAGLAAALTCLAIGQLGVLHVSVGRAALAIPAALLIAVIAGALPARRAARAEPLAAVQPVVRLGGRAARHPASIQALAWTNLRRVPARSALAGGGLVVAVAAVTFLAGITFAFRNAVTGSLLGSAVSLQIRAADWIAAAAMMLLAAFGVANVVFLNIRERGAELATLQAVGWTPRSLLSLLAIESVTVGSVASAFGALLGVTAAAVFAGSASGEVLLIGVATALAGAMLSAVAGIAPLLLLARLPTAVLLTEQ